MCSVRCSFLYCMDSIVMDMSIINFPCLLTGLCPQTTLACSDASGDCHLSLWLCNTLQLWNLQYG